MSQKAYASQRISAPQIVALYAGAVAIVLAGLGLAVASIVSGYSFNVMGNEVHGAVFGTVVGFLGIRYFLSVQRLAQQIDKRHARFSWANVFPQKKNH